MTAKQTSITLRRVATNGVELNVAIAGAGSHILLLHGWPHIWQIWTAILPNSQATHMRDGGGESQQIAGKALKGRRDYVVLATKLHLPMGDDPNHQGHSRRWIMTEVEHSLRRLQTDHIDHYQLHRPDSPHRH